VTAPEALEVLEVLVDLEVLKDVGVLVAQLEGGLTAESEAQSFSAN